MSAGIAHPLLSSVGIISKALTLVGFAARYWQEASVNPLRQLERDRGNSVT